MNGENSMTFLMLPNDLILNCLARVSRLYYPILSLVSKRLHSLVASIELYQTRILLGHTETCLYVCLTRSVYFSPQQWFTLCHKPNSSKKILVPITSLNPPCRFRSSFARVGYNIYSIGGLINDKNESSSVMVVDCRSHTWHEAPSMQIARESPSVCTLDDKIYVTGGCENPDSTNLMEIFDTKTQNWEFQLSPRCSGFKYKSIGYDRNVYVNFIEERMAYKLMNNGRWREADLAMNYALFWLTSSCVIENVLYRSSSGIIRWYNSEERLWKQLKGLENLEKLFRLQHHVEAELADYGGKMAVLWKDNVVYTKLHNDKRIRCAVLSLEKRQDGSIWATLEWSDVVSTTNYPLYIVHVLAATL